MTSKVKAKTSSKLIQYDEAPKDTPKDATPHENAANIAMYRLQGLELTPLSGGRYNPEHPQHQEAVASGNVETFIRLTQGVDKRTKKLYTTRHKGHYIMWGKVPMKPDWTNQLVTDETLYAHPFNIGWVLGDNHLVIDVDPRNFENGVDSFKLLCEDLHKVDPSIKLTPVVNTPSGGFHVYMTKPADFGTLGDVKPYVGIDFLTKGKQCVIRGSKTKDTPAFEKLVEENYTYNERKPMTEGEYTNATDSNGLIFKPAPQALLDIIGSEKQQELTSVVNGASTAAGKADRTVKSSSKTSSDADNNYTDDLPKPTADQLRVCLKWLDARMAGPAWWKVGAGLNNWDNGGDKGLNLFKEWSATAGDKADLGEATTQYHSINSRGEPSNPSTYKTIITMAKAAAGDKWVSPFTADAKPDAKTGSKGDNPYLIDGKPWVNDYIYVRQTQEYCSTSLREQQNVTLFKDACDWRIPKAEGKNGRPGKPVAPNARDYVMKNNLLKSVYGKAYMPSMPTTTFIKDGREYLNTFYPETVPSAATQYTQEGNDYWERFLKHLIIIFGETYAPLALNYIAFLVQHPGEKLLWALIVQGPRRCGKSFFKYLLELVMGVDHVTMVSPDELTSKFNEYAEGHSTVFVEEFGVKGPEKYATTQAIKILITEPRITINTKFGKKTPNVFNVTNYFGITNDKTGIPPEEIDGRFCVIFTPFSKADDMSFYKHLKSEGYNYEGVDPDKWKAAYFTPLMVPVATKDANIGAQMRKRLLDHKISQEFYNLSDAPQTEYGYALADSARASIPGLNQLEELLEEGGTGYSKEMLSFDTVWKVFDAEYGDKVVYPNERGARLSDLGMVGKAIRVDGGQKRVWIPSEALNMKPKELAEIYGRVFETKSQQTKSLKDNVDLIRKST